MKSVLLVPYILLLTLVVIVNCGIINTPKSKRQILTEKDTEFWLNEGKSFVKKQRNLKANVAKAKNIIMFMGDGMSMTTLAATRPYIGGEEKYLSFEEFPYIGMAKTYCVDYQVPDSACTGTAYLTGAKSNFGTIGVTAKVPRSHCTAELDRAAHTSSIAKWAMDSGKWAGFVTTSAVTDSSPANLYAHSANSAWQNDLEIRKQNCDPAVIEDIARQLILSEVGRELRVIMGGGRQEFRSTTAMDEENQPGSRGDGRNLINEWIESKRSYKSSYVWNAVSRHFCGNRLNFRF